MKNSTDTKAAIKKQKAAIQGPNCKQTTAQFKKNQEEETNMMSISISISNSILWVSKNRKFSFNLITNMPSPLHNSHVFSFQSAIRVNDTSGPIGAFLSETERFGMGSIGPGGPSCSGLQPDPVMGMMKQQQDYELSPQWTIEEQKILKQGLVRYATDRSMMKYIKIAAMLPRKTVRDVASRCRWLAEKMVDSCSKGNTRKATSGNTPSFSPTTHQVNQNVQFRCEAPVLDSGTRQLMEENIQVLHQISANLATSKIQENVDLFCHVRNNITRVLNNMNNMPGIMSRMLPLPVLINDELLNAILPNSNQAFMFSGPGIH